MVHYDRPGDDISQGLVGYWKLDDLKRIPSDGIVAHYKMNDNAANTIVIDSKGGNNGVAVVNTSTKSVAGKINEALTFNGVDDKIVINNVKLTTAENFTISLWIKAPNSSSTKTSAIISFRPSSLRGIGIQMTSGGLISFFTRNDGGVTSLEQTSVAQTNLWQNIIITLRASDLQMELFINGVSEGTDTGQLTLTPIQSEIGGSNIIGGNAEFFDGLIDDTRIYNRVLSQSEVDSIYNSGTGTETTELFRDTVVAIDRANFNDGTIVGCTNAEGINWNPSNSMSFDGVDDGIDISDTPILNTSSIEGLTISMWIFPNTEITASDALLSKATNGSFIGYEFLLTTTDKLLFTTGNGIAALNKTSVNAITFDKWQHIAVTWKNNGEIIFYIDGIAETAQIGQTSITNDPKQLEIAQRFSAQQFNGKMSRVRLYYKALTSGQISKLHRLRL